MAFENSDYNFGLPWFFFEGRHPDVQRFERGPPPFAAGGHGKHGRGPPSFAHGHGNHGGPAPGHGNGKGHGKGHENHGHHGGHGDYQHYPDCSEEYMDSYEDSKPMRTTKR